MNVVVPFDALISSINHDLSSSFINQFDHLVISISCDPISVCIVFVLF